MHGSDIDEWSIYAAPHLELCDPPGPLQYHLCPSRSATSYWNLDQRAPSNLSTRLPFAPIRLLSSSSLSPMQPMWIWILPGKQFEETHMIWKHTVEKSQASVGGKISFSSHPKFYILTFLHFRVSVHQFLSKKKISFKIVMIIIGRTSNTTGH